MPLLDSTLAQVLFAFAMIGVFALILRWTFSRDVRTMPDAAADSPGGDAIGVTDTSLTVTGGSDEPRESPSPAGPSPGGDGPREPSGTTPDGPAKPFRRRGSDRGAGAEKRAQRDRADRDTRSPAPSDPAFSVFAELPSTGLPPDPEDYGLLAPATIVDTADEANQIKALLAKSGIRATTALGTDRYVRVLVFRREVDRARRLILRRPAE